MSRKVNQLCIPYRFLTFVVEHHKQNKFPPIVINVKRKHNYQGAKKMEQRLITGIVDASGNPKVSADDFTSCRLKEGVYVVEFKQPLPYTAVPVATVMGRGWKTFNMSIAILDVTPSNIVVATSNSNQTVDCDFSFLIAF